MYFALKKGRSLLLKGISGTSYLFKPGVAILIRNLDDVEFFRKNKYEVLYTSDEKAIPLDRRDVSGIDMKKYAGIAVPAR